MTWLRELSGQTLIWVFQPRVLYKLLWQIASHLYAYNNCTSCELWSLYMRDTAQPPRLWWQWLTLRFFDSDSLRQSVLSVSAAPVLPPWILIRAASERGDGMQSENSAIHAPVAQSDTERSRVSWCRPPARSLKDFSGTAFTYRETVIEDVWRGGKRTRNNTLWIHREASLIASSIDALPAASGDRSFKARLLTRLLFDLSYKPDPLSFTKKK